MNLFDFAREEAIRQGVDPDLVARTMRQESGGDPNATSPKGAHGPMQLMPGTARDMGVNPNDPQDNIRGGVRYLKQQLDRFGSPELALAAYNAGPGAVLKAGGVPNYPETQGYVRKIMGNGQPQSGADIFGAGPVATAAPQGASGADIFADAPPSQPAPQEIAASHNRGVTIDVSPAAPVAPPQVSQRLGFEQEFAKPYGNAGNWLAAGADKLGIDLSGVRQIARNLQEAQAASDAKTFGNAQPGKVGQFLGAVGGTAGLPGGPMVNGALTGALLSDKKDLGGVAGDALTGAIGGKIGSSIVGGAGKLMQGVTDPAVQFLASKGVPLTLGQLAGGATRGVEDRMAGLPIVGDVIRNAQRRSLQGANRAAFNDTLSHVGESLPDNVDIGHDAYNYTKQRLSDLYDQVLTPLTVAKDQPWGQALSAAKAKIAQIGDPTIRANALNIIKTDVNSRFDKAGQIVGQDLKDVQSDLGSHVNDLMQGTTWQRKAGAALKDVKGALEDLVARTDPAAGDQLAQVNKAYASLKPLETATAKAGLKDGIFTMNQLAQGVTKGKSAASVAAGNVPQQDLASAAVKVLPSTVPDSGTAGRLMAPAVLAGLLSGHLPVAAGAAPVAVPTAGLIGGTALLYTRAGQKALTKMLTSRTPQIQAIGEQLRRLAAPAGTVGAVTLSGARQ